MGVCIIIPQTIMAKINFWQFYKVQKAGLPTIGGSPGFFDLLFLSEFAAYCFAAYSRLIYVCAFFQVWEVYIRLASERGDFVAANGVDVDNAV